MTIAPPRPSGTATRAQPTLRDIAVSMGLMDHQLDIFEFIVTNPYVGVWLGVGGGKTLSVLRALQVIRPQGHILVVAPPAIARSTWIDEIEKWGLPIKTRSLIVNERDKKLTREKRLQRYAEVLADEPTMYFINQELVDDLVNEMPIQDLPDGTKALTWPFQTVIIDESQGMKSHDSERFKAMALVRPAISRLIELTGTPAPNGLHDLWSQVYLLDMGQALGRNITAFRERWFTAKTNANGVPTKWVPRPGAEEEIYAAIDHLVMSAKNTSLLMPEKVVEDVFVTLPKEVLESYKDFKRELVLDVVNEGLIGLAGEKWDQWLLSAEPEAKVARDRLLAIPGIEDREVLRERMKNAGVQRLIEAKGQQMVTTIIAKNTGVLSGKLSQFSSGTIYTGADDVLAEVSGKSTGDVPAYEVVHEAKLDIVEQIVRDHGGRPVLLTYHFKSDREQLLSRLRSVGIGVEVFDGSRAMVKRWNAKQIQVMMLHPASAGHGLNLQGGGSTLVWYTLPFSLEHYEQAIGRLFRTGQTETVRIIRIIARGTQDDRMPGVLAAKAQVQENLLLAVQSPSQRAAATAASSAGAVQPAASASRAPRRRMLQPHELQARQVDAPVFRGRGSTDVDVRALAEEVADDLLEVNARLRATHVA